VILVVVLAAVAAIAGLAAYFGRLLFGVLEEERARTRELLTLVEAQKAPAQYAAYIAPKPESPVWQFDETGLYGDVIDDG